MAQLQEEEYRKSKKYSCKKSLRVDLTPMVDLGFLLITFFVLTTALSQPTIAKLVMPKGIHNNIPIKKSSVLTLVLMRNDSIGWYEGTLEKNQSPAYCGFNSLRSVIQQKQVKTSKILGDPSKTTVIIFPGKESTYKNLIDVLDEIQINGVKQYFVMDSVNQNTRLN